MEKEIQYCVVATRRHGTRKNRVMVTRSMSKEKAEEESQRMQKDRWHKSAYKYFKVAKHPYKEKNKKTK